WTFASSGSDPAAVAGEASADALSVLAPGDRTAQDDQRRVKRELSHLLGATLAERDQRVVALVELGAKRCDRRLDADLIANGPLRHRRVAGLVHPDESRHGCVSVYG